MTTNNGRKRGSGWEQSNIAAVDESNEAYKLDHDHRSAKTARMDSPRQLHDSIFESFSGTSQSSQLEDETVIAVTLNEKQKKQLQDAYQNALTADTIHAKEVKPPLVKSTSIPRSGVIILNDNDNTDKKKAMKKKMLISESKIEPIQEMVYRDRAAERRKQYNQPDKPAGADVYPSYKDKDTKEKVGSKDGDEVDKIGTATMNTDDAGTTTGVSFTLQSKYKGASLNRSLTSDTNNPGYQIMKKLGWKKGTGLGKGEQGIKAPLKAQDVRPNHLKGAGLGAGSNKQSRTKYTADHKDGADRAPKLDARSVKAYTSKKALRELAQQRFNRLK